MRSRLGTALSCGFGGRRLLSNQNGPTAFKHNVAGTGLSPEGSVWPASVSPLSVHRSVAGTGERSRLKTHYPGFVPFAKSLFHPASLAPGNFPFQFGQQRRSSAARRETTLDLFVPGFPVAFAEPACQGLPLLWWWQFNRLLASFQGQA